MQTPGELPIRAWQADVELGDTPRRIDGSQDKPFPSKLGRWFVRRVKGWTVRQATPLVDTGDI